MPDLPSATNDLTPESPPIPSELPPVAPVSPIPPQRGKKKLLAGIILIVVIIVAAVAAAIVLKSNNKQATVTKKDIPVLSLSTATGGEVPQYPVTYLYANVDIEIALQLYEGLVGYQDQTKVVPLLATSWSNPNDTTWIFNLRQGVKFHSGRTMTAQDVKYTLDYAVTHQNANNGNSAFYYLASTIKQVTVNGTYRVTVTTNTPDAVLLNQLGLIGIVDSKATLGDYNAGTGPYTVKPGTTPTASSIDLTAYSNYWGGHVYTREVKINLTNDADQLATDANNGKFDLAGYFDVSQLAKIKRHYQPINIPDQGLNFLTLNTEKVGSPLQSLAARQAVAYALDIPAILKAGGLLGQQDSQIVPLQLPGHNPAIQNTPYDPAKAKALLATVKNASAQILFAYPTGDDPQVNEMAKELGAVGFNVKTMAVDDFSTYIHNGTAGLYDITTEGDTSATVDGLDILTDLLEGNKNYSNPQVDSLITQAGSTLNASSRINEMQQVATIVANDKAMVPLYTQTRAYVLTKPNYVLKADLPDLDTSVYFWQAYQK